MEVIISNLGSYFKNKKIFIAGGTGLIGATLSNKLTNLNANVISASIDSKKRAELVLNKPKIFRYIDFRNINECKRYIRNSDIVVNLMGVRESTQLGISRSASAFSAFLVCNTNIIEGFDFGNSPFHYMNRNIQGKTLVLTTTNGTKAINTASNNIIITSSYLNIKATSKFLINAKKDVNL